MAGLNFDDGEKKPRDILDLSHVSIKSGIELKKWMEKVPDFKIRPEKVRWDEIRIDEDQIGLGSQGSSPVRHAPGGPGDPEPSTTSGGGGSGGYQFCDPVPASMKDINLKELGRVNINWRMLTVARPKNKLEEDIFSRLIQLEKLQYKTIQWEIEQEAIRQRKGGSFTRGTPPIRGGRTRASGCGASRSGGAASSCSAAVTETRLQTCKECGEEFCSGQTCQKYLYDDHARTLNPPNDDIFKIQPRGSRKSKKTSGGSNDSKLDDGRAEVDDPDDLETLAGTAGSGANGTHARNADTNRAGGKSNIKKVSKKPSTSQVENGAKTKVHKVTKKTSKKR